MRLAYLTTRYPFVSHTFIKRELREMERRGHSVLRLALRPSEMPLVDDEDQEEAARTVHCLARWKLSLAGEVLRAAVRRPIPLLKAVALALEMGRRSERGLLRHLAYLTEACFFLRLLKAHKIEHLHAHFGTNATAVARLCKQLGGPSYSFTVHGPAEFDAPRSLDLRGKTADAAFVIAISDFCSAQLRRWIAIEDWPKIHVVHCVVCDEFFEEPRPVDSRTNALVCVGRLCPAKGQLLLIDAFAEVVRGGVDARLVLAGDGELRPAIERRIQQTGVGDRVTITGWISGQEVRRQTLAARALILPSFAEGLPVVIMEAMAMARPVISTCVAAIPELVRPGENGWLVPAGNQQAMASAIREAMLAPVERLRAMGANGRELVKQQHCPNTEATRLERLFRCCAAREATGTLRSHAIEGLLPSPVSPERDNHDLCHSPGPQ